MIIVPEKAIGELISPSECLAAVEQVFASMARRSAYNFPVIREAIGYQDALYGFKSGFDRDGPTLGLKAGGFWPHNMAKGITNHQSSVFLFDADTGRCRAIVGGNLLTALRTAAARPHRRESDRHHRGWPSIGFPAARCPRSAQIRAGGGVECRA